MLARSAGEMLFRLIIMIIPAILCGYWFFGLQPPVTSLAGILFAVTLLIGYLISFHLGFLLGTVSLVTIEIHSIDWAFDALTRVFSGQFVPIWLFPGVLGTLAAVLPFGSLLATPLSIYGGRHRAASTHNLWTEAHSWERIVWSAHEPCDQDS